ncbi:MAG: SRPBCC family protein [Bacteroidota bacterium]
MEFKKSIIIDKSIEEVWEVLGNQYGEAYKWVSGLSHSEAFGKPTLEGASCSSRACDTTFGSIKEQVRIFDAQNYILEYEVVEGFPGFMESAINNWKLTKTGANTTRVDMHLTATTKGLVGKIMRPMMKLQMGKATANAVQDLKHYVETGQPSALKAKELSKQLQVAA